MSDGWPGDELRDDIALLQDRVRHLEHALLAATQSLETLSKAGFRKHAKPGYLPLEDMHDVRGYATSRANAARAALEKK